MSISGTAAAAFVEAPVRTKLATVVGSSLIGTTIEYYDFFIYGTAAALVFPQLFFPGLSPLAGIMAAYATLAIPFVTRPIGAVVFGHYGDRYGRKSMLILALTIMGLSTFAIGLVPSFASIGLWAPILVVVLRLAQGFAIGGEWGGAATMVVEYAPPERRGFYGTFVQLGNVIGLFISTIVFAVIPREDLLAGGWRIPFLLSIIMLGIGLFIRSKIAETPLFVEEARRGRTSSMPVLEVLRHHKRAVLTAMGLRTGEIVLGWLVIGFLLSYATRTAGFSAFQVLTVILAASVGGMITFPLFGMLSDRIGRKPVYLFGACVAAAAAFPMFWLINSGSYPLFVGAIVVGYAVGLGAMFAVQPAFFSEAFDTSVRYTGISLGCQLANIIGGLTPLIATSLAAAAGGASWPISLFLLVACLITAGSVLSMRETAGEALR